MSALVAGSEGEAVGQLHQRLLELGFEIAPDELLSMSFGASTLSAVLDFQSIRVDMKGRALKRDGEVGPTTRWALENPFGPVDRSTAPGWRYDSAMMRPEVRAACMSAISDLGRREDPPGSNSGDRIEKFNPMGLPWCAMGVSVWLEALDGGSPFKRRLRSVAKIVDWGKSNGRIVPASDARPGDIWTALRGDGHGHCELIVGSTATDDGQKLCLVGANVGNAVRGTVRAADSGTGIVRAVPVLFGS